MNRYARLSLLSALLATLAVCARGQQPTGWTARFTGRELYIKGLWQSDQLHFDGTGKLIEPSPPGSATLAGIDVDHAGQEGNQLVIEGFRVALVAKSSGPPGLERQRIDSTTHIAFSLRRGDKSNFHAPEHLRITVEPDSEGSYEAALRNIFAEGQREFAASLPLYWTCYARAYLLPLRVSATADKDVEQCVSTPDGDKPNERPLEANFHVVPPKVLLAPGQPLRLGDTPVVLIRGTAVVHLRVREDGVPVGLQVVQALGGGMDEQLLATVSQYRFQPATLRGVPVPFNMDLTFHFQSK